MLCYLKKLPGTRLWKGIASSLPPDTNHYPQLKGPNSSKGLSWITPCEKAFSPLRSHTITQSVSGNVFQRRSIVLFLFSPPSLHWVWVFLALVLFSTKCIELDFQKSKRDKWEKNKNKSLSQGCVRTKIVFFFLSSFFGLFIVTPQQHKSHL